MLQFRRYSMYSYVQLNTLLVYTFYEQDIYANRMNDDWQ